jgi:hypothetical protein
MRFHSQSLRTAPIRLIGAVFRGVGLSQLPDRADNNGVGTQGVINGYSRVL